jgi:2'-5' RNA ligase
MPQERLYFIALLPPHDVAAQVTEFKMHIATHYNSSRALRVLPHITLKAPFKLSAAEHAGLLEWFKNLPAGILPFMVELKDFGAFANKNSPVIFVPPQMSEQLGTLQAEIIDRFAETYPKVRLNTFEHEFKPHMTIAYRDLAPKQFEEAWAVYKDKEFYARFVAERVSLLQHNGLKWNVIAERALKQ